MNLDPSTLTIPSVNIFRSEGEPFGLSLNRFGAAVSMVIPNLTLTEPCPHVDATGRCRRGDDGDEGRRHGRSKVHPEPEDQSRRYHDPPADPNQPDARVDPRQSDCQAHRPRTPESVHSRVTVRRAREMPVQESLAPGFVDVVQTSIATEGRPESGGSVY